MTNYNMTNYNRRKAPNKADQKGADYKMAGSKNNAAPDLRNLNNLDPSNLEKMVLGEGGAVSNAVPNPSLYYAICSLYAAESIGSSDPVMSQMAYLSAMFGLENYMANLRMASSKQGLLPEEMGRYMDLCRQLSDYCMRNGMGKYLSQGSPASYGQVSPGQAGQAVYNPLTQNGNASLYGTGKGKA